MAASLSFERDYQPQLRAVLSQNVDIMEQKINEARWTNDANEAERVLAQACDECVDKVKTETNKIKESIKQKRPSSTSSTEQQQRYIAFVQACAGGFRLIQILFDGIFARIRDVVKMVVDSIRKGLAWMKDIIESAFNAIRSLFNN